MISTEIGAAARLVGSEEAVRLIAEAGFDAWDLSLCTSEWVDSPLSETAKIEKARKLKEIGIAHGVVCNQAHAPFPSSFEAIPQISAAIRCAAAAGARICVVHPIAFDTSVETNAEFYRALLPVAKECGIKIAAENLLGWDDQKGESFFASCGTPDYYVALLNAVNDPFFVACLDIGHAEQRPAGPGVPCMAKALGERLQALHVHDNDCVFDSHQLPLTMNIDFDAVLASLRSVNYAGDFTLEAVNYLNAYTADTLSDGLRRMADVARSLANRL